MFLIINKLGYFPNVNVFSLLLTVFLVAVIVKSLPYFNFVGILLPIAYCLLPIAYCLLSIAFICIIYDKELGITNITPWTVLISAILGSIGLSIIFHKRMKGVNTKYNCEDYKFEKIDVEDESNVRFKNSFN